MHIIFLIVSSLFQKQIKLLIIILLIIIYLVKCEIVLYKMRKLKRKIDELPPIQKKIINNYFLMIPTKYSIEKQKDISKLISFFSLTNFSEISNNTLKYELKKELLKKLQIKHQKKIFSEIKFIYVDKSFRFGNSMVVINNLLYYCEILNITNIYLNSNEAWPIFHNITSNIINITLIPKKNVDFNDKTICIFDRNFLFYQRVIKPEIRIDFLKNEIKNYLPKIKVNPNDLFIHIRSGDIFNYRPSKDIDYAQPPLCFYQSILNKYIFKKIYIICENRKNPIINLLIKEFPQIILANNPLEVDISLIVNAYKIVASTSSFLATLIIINENLKVLWEFDNYKLPLKYLHLHHDIYNYKANFSIYKMNPSIKYKYDMFVWRNSKHQIDLMIHEKCNNFEYFSN